LDNLNSSILLETASAGSFKKAAEKLGYTQAGIAYSINNTEKAWGIKIFSREYGGVALTPEGELLLPLIQQIHNAERQLAQKINEINALQTGEIRIVAFETIFANWIPGIVAAFHKDYPNISFEFVSCENRDEAEKMVLCGDVDLGFFILPTAKALQTLKLAEEPMLAIVSPSHPLAGKPAFPTCRIADYPFIAMKNDANSELAEIFQELGITPKPAFTVESDSAAMAFVSENLGYAIFSETAVKSSPFPLCALPFDTPIYRTIVLGAKDLTDCSAVVTEFIRYTKDWVLSHILP